jgi:transposase-like protein
MCAGESRFLPILQEVRPVCKTHNQFNHTQKAYARGDVHENRAECLFSLLKPYLRVFRGVSKMNLPGYVGFFQFLRNFRQRNAFEQAEFILQAALDPAIARRARQGEFVTCFDHFDLLQTAIN